MDRAKVNKYRVQLEALRGRIREDGNAVTDQALDSVNGELSHVPMHLGDLGSEEFLRNISAVLAENESYLAGEVHDALARIEAGTFGTCEHCEKAITQTRLEAIPFVRYCVKCAAEFNGAPEGNVDVGRPHRPEDTIAPEGDMAEDRRRRSRRGDVHAVGDAGGGTAWGGLGGSNLGHGDPTVANLQDAAGSGNTEAAEERVIARSHAVEPVGYETAEDLERYAQEEREREQEF
jgi:RNA polymerase-binding transcription factor DksA